MFELFINLFPICLITFRKQLERAKYREDVESPPQHEEYYVYRRYTSHEESYDYYYGPHSEQRPGPR